MKKISKASDVAPTLHSQDVLAGLGAAPRDLLATCLALFEDSTLQQRLGERIERLKGKITKSAADSHSDAETANSLQKRVMHWMSSSASDQELRLVLWMRLREAFGLAPVTFGSIRATRTVADDLVASAISTLQPGLLEKAKRGLGWGQSRDVPATLDALARQTMQELVESLFNEDGVGDPEARKKLIRRAREQIERLDTETRERLRSVINARELNDDAIRTLLVTGGGLAALGGAVSVAGFSAYILAAQASAFIPLVSGPALVSFVAVLSNPFTIVFATAGMGVYATRSANQKIQAAIATRVIALLALGGMAANEAGLRALAGAFRQLPEMRQAGSLPSKVLPKYQADWEQLAPAYRNNQALEPALACAVDQAPPGRTLPDRWRSLLGNEALQDLTATSALTVGELIYQAQAIDPQVLTAADFARVEDLSNPVAFAAFAHRVDGMGASSRLGAQSNLEGYVAERMVAARLVDQGHVVEFPSTSNQAGRDLSIDGVKFQIKNASDLGLLQRHFEHGYDYPIIANAEVSDLLVKAGHAGRAPEWASHVHFVEGYSGEAVHHATAESLQAGDGMLHPHVPVFAVTINSIRQLWRYRQGQVTGSQAIQEVLITGTVSTGLAVVGNYVGVGIGLLVFGPAGGLVLGTALPILSRTQVSRTKRLAERAVRGEQYIAWEKRARRSLMQLIKVLRAGLDAKETLIVQRANVKGEGAAHEYVAWRLHDDLGFLRDSRLRLLKILGDKDSDVEDIGAETLRWLTACGLHPVVYQTELRSWLESLEERPGLGDSLGDRARDLGGIAGDAARNAAQSVERSIDALSRFWKRK